MNQNLAEQDAGNTLPGRGLLITAAVLALVALIVSGYLSMQTLTGQAVAGCGGDDGCGAVLASPWSKVAGLPVSLLGSAAYVAVLLGLGLRLGSKGNNKLGDFLLLASAPAMIIAAVWFTYIQLAKIGEVCPYCMVDHGVGVVLAFMLPIAVLGKSLLRPGLPLVLGVVGCVGMIGLQHVTLAEDTQSTANPFVDRDGDSVIDGKRHISMFGGEVQFILEETPHIGDPGAKQVVGLVFDYACPHCRATHIMIDEAIKADPLAYVVVPLPISINERYNQHINSDNERFANSYELAVLSIAVADADLNKWAEFDKWLFSDESVTEFPRSLEDAWAKAVDLIGEEALELNLEYGGEFKSAIVDRNIELMAAFPDDSRYIPVVTSPGAPRHLTERFYEIDVLEKLLEEAEAGLEAIDSNESNAAP